MLCPKCDGENAPDAHRCAHCGGSLSVACSRSCAATLPEKIYFLSPARYTVGRARHNDLSLTEPSISKVHARIVHEERRFFIEDQGSLHGVYVNAARVQRAELAHGAQIQLGNVTLKFSPLGAGRAPRSRSPSSPGSSSSSSCSPWCRPSTPPWS